MLSAAAREGFRKWFECHARSLDITVENACGSVKVKFGGVTHINFRLDRYLGFQSWRSSNTHYFIEIKLVGGKISAEYDDREKWETIIAGLDKAVAQ